MTIVAQANEVKQGSYQLFDALTDDEYKALKDDIRERGVLVPVELDENGIILDGHHRVRAWNELCEEGVEITPYLRNYRYDLTEEQKRSHVRALNILRRHLNQDQKRRAIAEQLKETPERSNRQIGEELGVDHKTVGTVRDDLESIGEIPQLDTVTQKNGKSYPARKPKAQTPGIVTTSTTTTLPKTHKRVRALAAKLGVIEPEKLEILTRLHKSAKAPDSNETFDEIELTGGFQHGKALEKWCNFGAASISEIHRALKSLEAHHRQQAVDERILKTEQRFEGRQGKQPRLIMGRAESMPIDDSTIDLIITSPPYNLGGEHWPMGGDGRQTRAGIGYEDDVDELAYQDWQIACLVECYRVARPGASLFYNHKVRIRDGAMIHPMDWLRDTRNLWTLRQEIIWDRTSTHNHTPQLFWPEDERIYWLTKGKPRLPEQPIGKSTVWREFGPVPNQSWHPAPFTEALPEMVIQAVGQPGMTVLDPFAGSFTTVRVALRYGMEAVGVDVNSEYVSKAARENGWTQTQSS